QRFGNRGELALDAVDRHGVELRAAIVNGNARRLDLDEDSFALRDRGGHAIRKRIRANDRRASPPGRFARRPRPQTVLGVKTDAKHAEPCFERLFRTTAHEMRLVLVAHGANQLEELRIRRRLLRVLREADERSVVVEQEREARRVFELDRDEGDAILLQAERGYSSVPRVRRRAAGSSVTSRSDRVCAPMAAMRSSTATDRASTSLRTRPDVCSTAMRSPRRAIASSTSVV